MYTFLHMCVLAHAQTHTVNLLKYESWISNLEFA